MFPDRGSECSPSRTESECSTAKLPITIFSGEHETVSSLLQPCLEPNLRQADAASLECRRKKMEMLA